MDVKVSSEDMVAREIARFEASLVLPERFSEAVRTDTVLQNIQKNYQKAIRYRMGYLMKREADRVRREAHKLFRKQCRDARAPILFNETKCFPLEP